MTGKLRFALLAVLGSMIVAEGFRPPPEFALSDIVAVADARWGRFMIKTLKTFGSCGEAEPPGLKAEAAKLRDSLRASSTAFESEFSFDAGERVQVNLFWSFGDCTDDGCPPRLYARFRRGSDDVAVSTGVPFDCLTFDAGRWRRDLSLARTDVSDIGYHARVDFPSARETIANFRLFTDEKGGFRDIPFIWRKVEPALRELAGGRISSFLDDGVRGASRPLEADRVFLGLDGNPRRALMRSPYDWLIRRRDRGLEDLRSRMGFAFFGTETGRRAPLSPSGVERTAASSRELAKVSPEWWARVGYSIGGGSTTLTFRLKLDQFDWMTASGNANGIPFSKLPADDGLSSLPSRRGRDYHAFALVETGLREAGAYAFVELPSADRRAARLFVYPDENAREPIEVSFDWVPERGPDESALEKIAAERAREESLRILALGFGSEH